MILIFTKTPVSSYCIFLPDIIVCGYIVGQTTHWWLVAFATLYCTAGVRWHVYLYWRICTFPLVAFIPITGDKGEANIYKQTKKAKGQAEGLVEKISGDILLLHSKEKLKVFK